MLFVFEEYFKYDWQQPQEKSKCPIVIMLICKMIGEKNVEIRRNVFVLK